MMGGGLQRMMTMTLAVLGVGVMAGCASPTPTPTADGVLGPKTGPGPRGDEATNFVPPGSEQPFVYRTDQPVLQIEEWQGFVSGPRHAAAMVPPVTIWGDGRVVYTLPADREDETSGLVREARLDEAMVRELVTQAAELLQDHEAQIDPFPEGLYVSDGGTVVFSAWTSVGRQTVAVYALNLSEPSGFEGDEKTPLMDEFRELYRAVFEALPEDGEPMSPDEVSVVVAEGKPLGQYLTPPIEWPEHLRGHLTGEDALRALALLSPGPVAVARIDGAMHEVTIVPVLPLLSLPALAHVPIPLHPEAVAYRIWGATLDEATVLEYRFAGVDREEVVAWYREAMPEAGWSLGRESTSEQVWMLPNGSRPEIATLRFGEDSFSYEATRHHRAYPAHPDSVWGDCPGRDCQRVVGVTVGEARDWFTEYLGYFGWEPDGVDRFRRSWGSGTSYDLLTISYDEVNGGVVMTPSVTTVHPDSPLPWPTPTAGGSE